MHSTCHKERMEIFNTINIPNNEKIVNIIRSLRHYGIKTTSVAVIYKPIENFENYIKEFSINSKCLGFDNTRIRINYTGDVETRNQFYDNFKEVPIDVCPGLMTKFLDFDNYKTNIYLGVKDLTEYVLGSEIILDDDGNLYLDYMSIDGLALSEKKAKKVSDSLDGKTFCITGTLSMSRDKFQSIIKANGGIPVNSVSGKTDYLIVGVNGGSKLTKAEKLGIKMITEAQFNKMCK